MVPCCFLGVPISKFKIQNSELEKGVALLEALQSRGIHYSLDAMEAALLARGNPERKVQSIIVAGTNGKGSTSAMLYWMLRRLGYRVGLYTSPHLIDVTERIRIDDTIPQERLAEYMLAYEAAGILSSLTYYEALTLTAFDWFAENEVEWAILEVGVGGRLDAVNLAPAEGAIITSIDFDHKVLLGDTIAQIAREKAGVIKEHRPVIAGDLPAEAMAVVESVATERGAMVCKEGVAWTVSRSERGWLYDGQSQLLVPKLALEGEHQLHNLGCALAALEKIAAIDPSSCGDQLRQALASVRWPARFEQVQENPTIVVDAAHNPAGARALLAALRERFGERKVLLVFAAFADKDHNAMLAALRPVAKEIWITGIPGQPRALAPEKLAQDPALAGVPVKQVPNDELLEQMKAAPNDEVFVVTGSIAFAGWYLEKLKGS